MLLHKKKIKGNTDKYGKQKLLKNLHHRGWISLIYKGLLKSGGQDKKTNR